MKKMTLAIAVVFFLSNFALATTVLDDVPPPWRGQWSTTSQVWEFNYDPDPPGSIENYYEPDGPAPGGQPPLPSTHVVVFPGDPQWMEFDTVHGSNRYGIWGLSGWIDVVVDNHEPPNEFKWVWVQLTWASDSAVAGAVPTLTNLNPAADPAWPVTLTDEIDWGDGWYTSTYQWRIYPNPEYEEFTIGWDSSAGQATIVGQLIIDTWCIPEPATLALLLAAGLFVMRHRRPN